MALVLLAGCHEKEAESTTLPAQTAATAEPTETTEAKIPGLEDSIFTEDVPEQTQQPTEETVPSQENGASSDGLNSGGLQDPPESENPESPEDPGTTEPETPDVTAPVDYERFQAMTPAQQQAYMESFDSMDAFFDWYEKAKAEYEAANPPIYIEDGSIDLDDVLGGKG